MKQSKKIKTKRYCFCENDARKIQSNYQMYDSNCNMPCDGNTSQLCGSVLKQKIRFNILNCKYILTRKWYKLNWVFNFQDIGYRFKCSRFVHYKLPVKCDLSVYTFNQTLDVIIDFQEETPTSYTLESTNYKFYNKYSSTGTFLVKLTIPSKNLTFNQTVIVHGKKIDFILYR